MLYQPYYLLALSQVIRGLHQEALRAGEKAYSLAPWSTTTRGLFGGILRRTGETIRADELHNELFPSDQYGAPMGLLLFHLACSETEAAAYWAERALEQRDPRMIFLMGLMRAFQSNTLRSDNRWSAIARTLGIPLIDLRRLVVRYSLRPRTRAGTARNIVILECTQSWIVGKPYLTRLGKSYLPSVGQFVEEHGQPDMLGLLQQIGAVPAA